MSKVTLTGDGITITFDVITNESVQRSGTLTQAPIEGNGVVSDHFARSPLKIQVVGVTTQNGAQTLANLTTIYENSAICEYIGRNWIGGVVITTFNSGHGAEVDGGFTINMTLTKVRLSSTQEFTFNTGNTAGQSASSTNNKSSVGVNQAATKNVDAVSTSAAVQTVGPVLQTYEQLKSTTFVVRTGGVTNSGTGTGRAK